MRGPVEEWAVGACQKNDGQDVGLQRLTGGVLRGGSASSGDGHRGLGLGPTYDAQGTHRL